MMPKKLFFYMVLGVTCLSLVTSGCSVKFQKGRRSDIEKINYLNKEIDALNAQLAKLQMEKDNEVSELEKTKKLLEGRLSKEIGDKDVRLEMAEKGLAIIFLAEVLFDSGKADIKKEAYGILDKITNVLSKDVGDRDVGIEGHTDNEPIKYSGWKSNWELSTARAISVLHYIVDEKSISPKRVAATGYGEYRPVVSNDKPEGRRQNRRVEIVILPKDIAKIQADMDKLVEKKMEIQRKIMKYKK
ncbi:MAG: OmpA family protein [Candidatus Omnitrophica bacterium]|nr:OmpA family protein [Candidatus Omnitrophota bacterium]